MSSNRHTLAIRHHHNSRTINDIILFYSTQNACFSMHHLWCNSGANDARFSPEPASGPDRASAVGRRVAQSCREVRKTPEFRGN